MTIAIIDGDVLAYMACKSRWQDKAVDGFVEIELDENGEVKPLEFTNEENRRYLEKSWSEAQKLFDELLEKVFCTDYLMAVKGENNFRNLLYSDYKMNRHKDPSKQNQFVPVLRKMMVANEMAVESTGREADDLMRIWAEQCSIAGVDYVICSIDKDLKCIPGKHYLMHKEILIEVSEEEAMRHYYEQLLKGDPTDNIPGVPRVGEVKAAKLLAPFNTEQDFQEQVVEQYLIAYGEDWAHYLLANAKMIHLQRDPADYFSWYGWEWVEEIL